MIKTMELKPITKQKSFYGKASHFEYKNRVYLVSYDTVVACFDKATGKMLRCIDSDLYSKTTAKHIKAFFYLFGRYIHSKKEFFNLDYLNASNVDGKFESNKYFINKSF